MICENPYVQTQLGTTRLASKKGSKVESKDIIRLFDCGKCSNCRAKQSNIWSTRLILEQKASKEALFITPTYEDEFCIVNDFDEPLLYKPDLQNYIKRLRRCHSGTLRHFSVGEYGSIGLRPHYHIALFSDTPINPSRLQDRWYRDKSDKRQMGIVHVGLLEEKSARYIAGYLKNKSDKTKISLTETRPPEFSTMSKQYGGIGYPYLKKIAESIRDDKYIEPQIIQSLRIGGKAAPLGRYLTRKLAEETNVDPKEFTKKYFERISELDEIGEGGNIYEYYENVLDHFRGARLSRKKKLDLKKRRSAL